MTSRCLRIPRKAITWELSQSVLHDHDVLPLRRPTVRIRRVPIVALLIVDGLVAYRLISFPKFKRDVQRATTDRGHPSAGPDDTASR